jgi:hypothetical protein
MFSRLDPAVVYTDVSSDITENDIDVMSDLWNIDDRNVYRGSRDPSYTHANVYWLYDEDLQRVGCCEHNKRDHADFRVLWFRESEFGTLFQEDGWTLQGDIWSVLPSHVFEHLLNLEYTTYDTLAEYCLKGDVRIVTLRTLLHPPSMFVCNACGKKTMRENPPCASRCVPLDFPNKAKIVFVDDDMIVHVPPRNSVVWLRLGLPLDDDSLQVPVVEQQAQETQPETLQEPSPPPHDTPPRDAAAESVPPVQSRPQTPEQPSSFVEAQREQM